jgi:hypothetical protein
METSSFFNLSTVFEIITRFPLSIISLQLSKSVISPWNSIVQTDVVLQAYKNGKQIQHCTYPTTWLRLSVRVTATLEEQQK